MASKIKIKVTMVPTEGQTTTKEIVVKPTGVTVADALKAAGVDPKNKDLLINGHPAELSDYVTANDQVDAKDRAVEVRAQERPRGS